MVGARMLPCFLSGLSQQIKDQLVSIDVPDELDSIIAIVDKIDRWLQDREKEWSHVLPIRSQCPNFLLNRTGWRLRFWHPCVAKPTLIPLHPCSWKNMTIGGREGAAASRKVVLVLQATRSHSSHLSCKKPWLIRGEKVLTQILAKQCSPVISLATSELRWDIKGLFSNTNLRSNCDLNSHV